MINLNTSIKLPSSLKWYVIVKLLLLFFAISFPFLIMNKDGGFAVFYSFVVLFGLPIWVYVAISYRFTSFIVGETAITINSGIMIKRSNAVSFNQVQNVNNTRGPLAMLFGLSKLNIWTASPSQIRIQKGESHNESAGMLWLKTSDAEWLKNLIMSKH